MTSDELVARGVSRFSEDDRHVLISFSRRPTDREIRELHDHLRKGIQHRYIGLCCDSCGHDPTKEYDDV